MVDRLDVKVIDEDIKAILRNDLPWEKFRNSTVLVTGASGMIPSYVVYTLLGLNDSFGMNIHVAALVKNEAKAKRILGSIIDRTDVTLIAQDVSIPVKIDGNIDYIIHGAGPARPKEHSAAPTATIRANLIGTFNLLDLAVEKKTKAFVMMSSSEVYGKVSEDVHIIKEDDYGYLDCLNPRSCYSEGKRAAETVCAAFQAEHGIRCVLPRFAHIYGPGLALDDGRVQADFAANVFRNEDIVMKSDGSSMRAYTYVADAVSGLFFALLKGDQMAYNIADSDNVISIRQLAEAFISCRPEKNLELRIEIAQNSAGKYNPAAFIGLDNSKITSLGWTPKVDINEGADRMLRYYEETI